MKLRNQLLKYNLQYFADNNGNAGQGEADNSGDDDGDDDQDDDDQDEKGSDKPKKSDKNGKYLTQDEINQIIEERLKRERKKLKQQQPKDEKQDDKGADDKSKDENAKKLSDLEMKVLCYDHDISKDYVKEAIALAKAYVDEDTDMDEALEMVTKKFPQFVKGYKTDKGQDDDDDEEDTDSKKSWGQRQKGASKKIDPVEARFLERNPGLKID